jgi:hypothetical protein
MREVNEFGYHQCPRLCSGSIWHPVLGWDPASKEATHEAVLERENRSPKKHVLQPWADYLQRSLRTTYDLAKANGICGLTYADGKVAVWENGKALVSTLGAGVHLFALPRDTEYIHAGLYSGLVSAVVPHHAHLEREYPKIKIPVEANSSGVNWGYVAFNSSGKPLVPPPPSS